MENTELEKVQPKKVTLMIGGKEREIKFGFSAWAKIEKEFGGLKHLDVLQKKIEEEPFSTIPHLIFYGLIDKSPVMIDGIEIPLTEENILDDYGLNDIQTVVEKFTEALYGSLPNNDESNSNNDESNSKKEVEAKQE